MTTSSSGGRPRRAPTSTGLARLLVVGLLLSLFLAGCKSSSAKLRSLGLDVGPLTPAFSSSTFRYTASVGDTVASVRVTPVAEKSGTTIRINGAVTPSGQPSAPLPLVPGTNPITVVVSGSGTETYTLVITRQSPPPNSPPTVVIASPASGTTFIQGATLTFTGSATDPEDGEIGGSIAWSSSRDGSLGTGGMIAAPALSVGTHAITAAITDSRGATSTAVIDLIVNPPDIAPTRPNILLIVSDDVGVEATSLYPEFAGNTGAVPTPHIESLAAHGLVFDNVWANPMCSPTRAALLSGYYGHRNGVTTAGDLLPVSTYSLFKFLADQSPGYAMGVFGKWHLSGTNGLGTAASVQHLRDLGVPHFWGFIGAGLGSYYNWTAYDITGTPIPGTTYATTATTDAAIQFLQQHRQTRPQDPWFIYVPYNAPHSPNQVPPAPLHSVPLGNLVPGQTANTVAVYKAMIQAMDTEIGRLLQAVGPPGSPERDRTVVLYMGDNGTPANVKDTGSRVRGAKQSVYEGGVKVPLVISGTGVTRRGRESALVVASDLYATIAALAGIPVGRVNDSFNLVPLLTDAGAITGRTHAFTELCGGFATLYAIRDSRYKMVHDNGSWGLYDLIADPLETTNLYLNAAYATVRADLQSVLDALKVLATDGCF